jgi:futalosine hydrolase
MQILIISATHFEVEPLLQQMNIQWNKDNHFYSAAYKNHTIDFLIAGVGMVATTYYATKHISADYKLVVNAGICGSFNKNLELGSVVHITEDCFSELGAEDGDSFLTLEQIGLNGIQKITNNSSFSNPVIDEIPKVSGITVNTTHGNEKNIEKIFSLYHPYVESMEGAAFMFVCEQEKVPYIQIRAVSNYVERRNKENWNIPLAIKKLNEKIIEILNAH